MGAEDLSSGLHSKFYPLSYLAAPEYALFDFRDKIQQEWYPQVCVEQRPHKDTAVSSHPDVGRMGFWVTGRQAWVIAPRGKGSQQVKLSREK